MSTLKGSKFNARCNNKSVALCFIVMATLCLTVSISAFSQSRQTKSPLRLTSPNDSLQYTLGAYMGQWITANGFSVSNSELFLKGMNDVLGNKPTMVPAASIPAKLESYQKRLISSKSSQQESLLFANLRGKSGVGMLPSGIGYFVMTNGNGYRPTLTDSVLIHVKGFLPDGKLFEDTYAKNSALRGLPSTFIPGLREVLQIMPVGSTWRVFIPAALGYGANGVPGLIPPYSALIFEVELLNATRSR
ncbi:FKBP-type peptidyl-prolyl cis-trans isomerase [Daejeonella lutea]|uniref:Peptidyl-prolyl cis-trans isomerase n=1 Tax=Daejeonella lutea TaxID=572036 RepID=A0A1T5C679_9SPHI|nr:FKBP-type peptidyl-prolyl cis-trans isomerase [Daejeonella lutea]SKB54849.1 FKBP-type peptidyl-prolyl cis-trans isomerase FklB [Daejeonella lutea]